MSSPKRLFSLALCLRLPPFLSLPIALFFHLTCYYLKKIDLYLSCLLSVLPLEGRREAHLFVTKRSLVVCYYNSSVLNSAWDILIISKYLLNKHMNIARKESQISDWRTLRGFKINHFYFLTL